MLQRKPGILFVDDIPGRGWVLSKILNSKGHGANSLTSPRNEADRIEKESPDLLIPDLDFSEASNHRTFPKTKEIKLSSQKFIQSDSTAEQLRDQATSLGVSVLSPKLEVEQTLERR